MRFAGTKRDARVAQYVSELLCRVALFPRSAFRIAIWSLSEGAQRDSIANQVLSV